MLLPLDPLRGAEFPEDDGGGTTGSLPESMSSKHSSINSVCNGNQDEKCGGTVKRTELRFPAVDKFAKLGTQQRFVT